MNPVEILCLHALRTLPDSITERREVLRAVHDSLADRNPLRREVRAALSALDSLELSSGALAESAAAARSAHQP